MQRNVAQGISFSERICEACHGPNGQGGIKDRLVGGRRTGASDNPVKTLGCYLPYSKRLLDYIHRAMPYQAPGPLSIDDTYAAVAYVLSLKRSRRRPSGSTRRPCDQSR
jgi:S-disulfanyl-L-cysteine oxidoreductase SoxD